MTTNIGKPVYGNNENRRPNAANANWKLDKEGSHVYRILPPFGLLAKLGRWSQYEALHWGPTLSNGKKRAFRCIERKNRKTKMVEVECPLCTKIKGHYTEVEAIMKEMKEAGKGPAEIKEATKALSDWLQSFNVQRGHFLNVLRPDGQIGRLFIKIKSKQALDIKIPKFIEKSKVDPIAADGGLWIDFQRSGMGRNDTVYDVALVEESVEMNGETFNRVKKAPLSAEVIARMEKEAFELATFYKDLTYDEVQMMVSSDFDPSIVDSIFGAPAVSAATAAEDVPEQEDEVDEETVVEATPKTTAKVESSSGVSAEEQAILDQLAAVRAKKSTPSTPKPSNDVSTEDFVNAFKTGKL